MHSIYFLMFISLTVASTEDEIFNLPGLNFPINFRQFSGYLNGYEDIKLHYWFVQSSRNHSTDPLILWLNGGPGCSSMEGFLNELGPFHAYPDGKTLYKNKYSWNNVLLTILQLNNNCTTGDDEVSLTNLLALEHFFLKFPEYQGREFYITGESYGGIYIPTLALRIIEGQSSIPINLKGYAVGNGLSSYEINDNSLIFFGYYHGLYGDDLWQKLVDHCCKGNSANKEDCNFSNSIWPMCVKAVSKASDIIYNQGLNIYNLYGDSTPLINKGHKLCRLKFEIDSLFRSLPREQRLLAHKPCAEQTDVDGMTMYLNNPDVRAALHIPKFLGVWSVCREYKNMKYQYSILTKKLPGLVYNGDIDMACNFLGDEWFVESLGLKVIEGRKMWHFADRIGGFVKRFENLDLLTIRGAGHMVPEDKPGFAYKMITSFIFGKPY